MTDRSPRARFPRRRPGRSRALTNPYANHSPLRLLRRLLYWLAVLIMSLAVLIAIILLLESRDTSQVGRGTGSSDGRR